MKKIFSLLIILATLLSLPSCGKKYEPIPSTEEESRVVMTLTLDGETYDVKYELYRAMFLAYKTTVDGGDSSVWSGDKKAEYIERIHSMILTRVTDIYAALHHAEELGINMYSSRIDSQIEEYIKLSVEGGVWGDEILLGHESYDAYLESLARLGMNYSTSELIYRYAIAIDLITEYYAGTPNADGTALEGGALEYTREDVAEFYFGDDSVRYMSAFVQSEYAGAYDRAEGIRRIMMDKAGDDEAVAIAIISNSLSSAADVKRGTVIGRYSLDEENYGALTEAAFSTTLGSVSDVVEITAGAEPGFFILYPVAKNEDHLDENYAEIASVYVENEIGKRLSEVQAALTESAEGTELLATLSYADITYPTVNK